MRYKSIARHFRPLPPSPPFALETLSYPSWTKDGQEIVLTNYASKGINNQRLLRTTTIPENPPFSVTCTTVTQPEEVWPGMSSVSPSSPDLVAFAGQTPNMIKTYDQNWNQIWVQTGSGSPEQVNGILGRAPWWSPTGDRIAYESIPTPTDDYNAFYRIWVIPYRRLPRHLRGGSWSRRPILRFSMPSGLRTARRSSSPTTSPGPGR